MGASIYVDLIMEHIRNARHYCVPERADVSASARNPLCGDDITVYLERAGGRIADVGYQCGCCGIAMASASIMAEMVHGRPLAEAQALAREMIAELGDPDVYVGAKSPERLALIGALRSAPSRIRCATLPWLTLERALVASPDAVTA